MTTNIYTATLQGLDVKIVRVEIDIKFQKDVRDSLTIEGLGRSSSGVKNRVTHALSNSGYDLKGYKIVVNISPVLYGSRYHSFLDFPIAVAILVALNIIPANESLFNTAIFCGELSLDGSLNKIEGALALAFGLISFNKKQLFIPYLNAKECSRVNKLEIYGTKNIKSLIDHLNGECAIKPYPQDITVINRSSSSIDLADVYGQERAKRALQIAAAGFHNLIMIGSPGSGKTMLAERIKTIMTLPSNEEILEINKIYSIAGFLKHDTLLYERPFRSPHHTISRIGLIGGGSYGQPGEISLAHNGVLFLDELTEFSLGTIEVLRQPLEAKKVLISRANYATEMPCNFLLIAACNPCPCGYFGDRKHVCTCSRLAREHYMKKLSGPFLDRIDLHVEVSSLDLNQLTEKRPSKTSHEIATEIEKCVEIQKKRNNNVFNAMLSNQQIEEICAISQEIKQFIETTFEKLGISVRSYHKVLKIARTIADLDSCANIELKHIKEAVMFRALDKI